MFRRDQVVPGVWRILMSRRLFGKELYPACCYAIADHGVLVDSGSSRFASEVTQEAEALGIRNVLLTHAHEDHTGAAAMIAEKVGARCFAYRDALHRLLDPHGARMHFYRRFFFGTPRPCRAEPLEDAFFAGNLRLEVLYAPGHSPDHVVFFEKERGWLFTGDVFIPTRDNVFFGIGVDLKSWIETLRTLSGLHASRMFTGMGVVSRRPSKVLREKANRYSDIAGQVLELRRQGLSEDEIAGRLFPKDRSVRWFTGGDFSAANFVRACLKGEQAV